MPSMRLREALEVLAAHRGENIVLTTMASIAEWPSLSDSPLDFAYLPSSMGQGTSLGLGLALAQSKHGVIVVNGDGSMLMNLGSLVTLAQHAVRLYVIVIDNQLYEVTGGQPTVGAGRVDYPGLARAAGFKRTYRFDGLDAWKKGAAEALSGEGPVFICLNVEGRSGVKTPKAPRPMSEQISRLRQALVT